MFFLALINLQLHQWAMPWPGSSLHHFQANSPTDAGKGGGVSFPEKQPTPHPGLPPALPPCGTGTEAAKSNNPAPFKKALKTENLCSMTKLELYITAL